jgi:hypothetical protein
MKSKLFAFLRSTFSEPDGTGSASRVLAGSTVASCLVWVSYIVFTQHHLPDLGGASLFVTAGGSLYGVNKLSVAIKGNGDVKVTDKSAL